MHIRSFYDAILLAPEGEGSPAPADSGAPLSNADTGDRQSEALGNDAAPKNDTETGNEPPPLEEQLADIWDKQHSPVDRDARGRFASRTPQDADNGDDAGNDDSTIDTGPDAATDDDEGADDLSAGDGEGNGPDEATDAMPRSWSKENAKVWAALPKDAKALLHKREQDMTVAISRAGHAVKTLRDNAPLLQGIDPYREYLAQREQATGVPSGRMVNDILRFAYSFDTAQTNDQKLGILQEIVGSFGIDLTPWIGADAAEALSGTAPVNDPRIDALTKQVEELTSEREQERERALADVDRKLASTLQTFQADTKNYPFFDQVRQTMGRLVGSLDPNDGRPVEVIVKEVYEQACFMTPKIRERLIRERREEIAGEHRQQAETRADKARRASAANVRSGVSSPSKRTMDDDIEAAAAKHYR